MRTRRFSQAISEGDGISVLVEVDDAAAAQLAAGQGAEGVVVRGPAAGVREATELPILWCAPGGLEEARRAEADAVLLVFESLAEDGVRLETLHDEAAELGLDCVVDVCDEDELEGALERIDPEIFLLSARRGADAESELEHVLGLLPDIPAGKLAVAELPRARSDEVAELERAGFDAVVVGAAGLAELAGGARGL